MRLNKHAREMQILHAGPGASRWPRAGESARLRDTIDYRSFHTGSNVIQVVINGEARTLPASLTVSALLETLALAGKKVAIERNGEIVPRSRHADTAVLDGDELEIVVAVGGG